MEEELLKKDRPLHSKSESIKIHFCAALSILVLIAELSGGFISGSLAIMTDAIITIPDISIFFVSSICSFLKISPSSKMSYGYFRIEILSFLMSVAIVWPLSFWLVYEIIIKIQENRSTDVFIMLIASVIGFFYNLTVWFLIGNQTPDEHSKFKAFYVNMKTKHTHFLIDLIESAVIIIAAVVLFAKPEWTLIDPLCAMCLIVIVLIYTIKATIECISVLMESAPIEIDLANLGRELSNIKGVSEIHDLHVWSLSLHTISLSCHMTAEDPRTALIDATKVCNEFGITHITIQIEEYCEMHSLDCANSQKL